MILVRCNRCNVERYSNHFRFAVNKDTLAFKMPCRDCLGIRVAKVEEYSDVNYNVLFLALTRLHFNDGKATKQDLVALYDCYEKLYGGFIPRTLEGEDRYVYRYERLKQHFNNVMEIDFKF